MGWTQRGGNLDAELLLDKLVCYKAQADRGGHFDIVDRQASVKGSDAAFLDDVPGRGGVVSVSINQTCNCMGLPYRARKGLKHMVLGAWEALDLHPSSDHVQRV